MNILHVIGGIPKAAGTSVFVGELASQQAADGHDVTILIKARSPLEYPIPPSVRIITKEKLSTVHVGRSPCSGNFDLRSQSHLLPSPEIVHLHALWDPWLTTIAKVFRNRGAKIVWSPHGMLTPWALKNKWPKKVAGLLAYQYWALHQANLLHATADSEVEDIRRLHLRNSVVVAPLGVKLGKNAGNVEKQRYICFVSRIQRKKGLPNLLKAWAQLPADLKSGWKIKIAGPDEENHLSELYALCDQLNISHSQYTGYTAVGARVPTRPQDSSVLNPQFEIEFLGPVYDDQKDSLYANAVFSVLPTHSENFGSVVIESLAQGTPVICTKGAPWRDLADYNCGWWIDIGVEPLIRAMTEAMQMFDRQPSDFGLLGQRGKALVLEKYAWPAIAKRLLSCYEGLINHVRR